MTDIISIDQQIAVERRFFWTNKVDDPDWSQQKQSIRLRQAYRRSREEVRGVFIDLSSTAPRTIIIADSAATDQMVVACQRSNRGDLFTRGGYPRTPFF